MYDGPNPCKKVQLPKLNNQITEFLSDNALGRFMDVLETWPCKMTTAFLKFLLYIGLRRGELFKLKWQDIDFNRQTITLRDPKGNKNQVLPLTPKALQVLREILRKHDTQFNASSIDFILIVVSKNHSSGSTPVGWIFSLTWTTHTAIGSLFLQYDGGLSSIST